MALNSQLDICVSGGCDGVVVIHSLRAGRRLRVIRMAEAQIANVVAVSSVGAIYVHTRGDSALRKFSCNAELLHTTTVESALVEIVLSADGRLVISTDAEGAVCVRAGGDLSTLHALDKMGAVSLALLDQTLVIGCTDGQTRVVTVA